MAFATPENRKRKETATPSFRAAKSKAGQRVDKRYTEMVREQRGGLAEPDIEPGDLFSLGKLGAVGLATIPAMLGAKDVGKAFGRYVESRFKKGLHKAAVDSDYVPTPKRVVDKMIDWVTEGGKREIGRTLEPHAGTGHIAKQIYKRTGVMPNTFEKDVGRYAELSVQGIPSRLQDFLTYESKGRGYDSIIMNPPFSQGQAKYHILKGEELLKEGGRMTAVVPAREYDLAVNPLRKWAESHPGVVNLGSTTMPARKGRVAVRILGLTKQGGN